VVAGEAGDDGLEAYEGEDLSPEAVSEIARRLSVPEATVVEMNGRLSGPDHSLNAPVDGADGSAWQDWLVDPSEDQEKSLADREELDLRRGLLGRAMKRLNERERRIFRERRLEDEPLTLEELSKEYGISRERVRQIEVRAFEKVQKAVKNAAAALATAG
jgi:RNA polymerase sigma-32 factor